MAHDKPDLEHGIYRVAHTLTVGGANLICESDLIFLDGQPFVVLDWANTPGSQEQYPAVKLSVDQALLEPGAADGYLVYSGQLVDPRKVQ